MLDWLWLIPVLPLLSAAALGALALTAPRASKGVVNGLALGGPGVSLAIALGALFEYLGRAPEPFEQVVYAWKAGELGIDLAFLLDPLSAVMLFVVTFVGFWIHVYSVGYMAHEEGYQRYFAYLNLFMGAMLLLVLGNNFLVSFIGWEGVGLCSYLLIGFYYKEPFPPFAGRKAFIVNRIGDFAFLVGMFALAGEFGTLAYRELFTGSEQVAALAEATVLGFPLPAFVAACLFIGAVGKSAQIPLYVWLPDAMAGPTPVSALIHAATMVTAGVYIVVRSNVLYQMAPAISLVVAVVGAATAIFAASIGLVQTDIKKVLAYSTVSQLGYMFLAAGVGAYTAAIFHLMTHAFFKALLFLGSGSVIHAMGGEQDMRRMGGLKEKLPVTYWTFLIAGLAIAGIPPLAGFFSKDEILAATAGHGHWILWLVGFATAGLTAFYMFRAIFMTFWGEFRGTPDQRSHLHESPKVMTVPLVVLAVGAVTAGWIGIPPAMVFNQADPNVFHHFLEPVIAHVGEPGAAGELHGEAPGAAEGAPAGEGSEHVEAAHLPLAVEWLLILASVGLAAGAIFLAWRLYAKRGLATDEEAQRMYPTVWETLTEKYYVDEIYDMGIVQPLGRVSRVFWKVVDELVIDGGVRAGAWLTELAGDLGRFSTTGNVRNYALYFFVGIVVLFAWILI